MNQICVKTNFTSGQLSDKLYGRGDLRIYENGAGKLQNVQIHPTGGVSRRKGLMYIDEIGEEGRLISFEFNTEQTYLICFLNKSAKVYKNKEVIATLETPWTTEQLHQINWTQSADTLLIVHPDVPPQQISRNNDEVWKISAWSFYQKDGQVFCPYYNFYQNKIKFKPSGASGSITITSDTNIFTSDYVGIRIKINEGEAIIRSVSDSKNCTAEVSKRLTSTTETNEWEEQAFSALRGYPNSVTFHQDRMVIGGSKSLPNHLWLSKSSDLFNFDIGTGLDDESIDFAILSDQVNAVLNVVSTRHLLVFTTGAEWMVSGEPLTPTSITLNRQTNIGTYGKCSLAPQNVDGATLFVSQNGKQLREFLYADVEQAYQAKDLTLLSNDIIKNPIDCVYFQGDSILYIILSDGTISCLTSYRTEEVNAWSKMTTQGKFISCAVIGDEIYFIVKRDEKYFLEMLTEDMYVDCGSIQTSDTAKKSWSGLDYLEGKEVSVVGDDFTIGEITVENGKIELSEAVKQIKVGLSYEHIIEPLPLMLDSAKPYPPKAYRMVYGIFRIIGTKSLCLDFGNGYFEVPLKKMYRDQILDSPPNAYSGDIELRSIGWIREPQKPMWSIKSSVPDAFELLSVATEIKTKD